MLDHSTSAGLGRGHVKRFVYVAVSWLAGLIGVLGLGYLVFTHLTAWAAIVQIAYVVPLVHAADRRGSLAFGFGVLCGAFAVLALNSFVGVFMWAFSGTDL